MLGDLRQRLGYHAALRTLRKRPVPAGAASPPGARVLALLPHEEVPLRAAWRLIQAIEIPRNRLVPVLTADRVAYAPDAYVGSVTTLGERSRDWRGLPRRAAAEGVWKGPLLTALDLTPGFDLASAYLVGASPARYRIGLYSPEGEPFYDLLLAPTDGYEAALQALRAYLVAIEPPVLPTVA